MLSQVTQSVRTFHASAHTNNFSISFAYLLEYLFSELGDGHYWVLEPGLNVTFPLRFIGDEHDPSHVIIELSGTVEWSGKGGWMEGITFRRPRMSADQTGAILRLHSGGRIDMGVCILDNEGSQGPVAIVTGEKSGGMWSSMQIKGSEASDGAIVEGGATLGLQNVRNDAIYCLYLHCDLAHTRHCVTFSIHSSAPL